MARMLQAPPHPACTGWTNKTWLPTQMKMRTPRSRGSLEAPTSRTPKDRVESLTRDIQRPSPCTSCTGVGLLAGFLSPLILNTAAPAEESGDGSGLLREDVDPPRPPHLPGQHNRPSLGSKAKAKPGRASSCGIGKLSRRKDSSFASPDRGRAMGSSVASRPDPSWPQRPSVGGRGRREHAPRVAGSGGGGGGGRERQPRIHWKGQRTCKGDKEQGQPSAIPRGRRSFAVGPENSGRDHLRGCV